MYQVFNMGQRLEIFTNQTTAERIVEIAASMGIEAVISGYVTASEQKEVVLETPYGSFCYGV